MLVKSQEFMQEADELSEMLIVKAGSYSGKKLINSRDVEKDL